MIHKKHRLGQIEMFGLAVIVVMLILGLFIYVSFKANKVPETPRKEFANDKMPSDFVLAILHVTVDGCEQFTVNDLIIDCARDHRLRCAGRDSCTVVNESINIMLNKTFIAREISFRFYSDNLHYVDETGIVSPNELFDVSYRGCTATSEQGRSGKAFISTYPAPTVTLYLNICG